MTTSAAHEPATQEGEPIIAWLGRRTALARLRETEFDDASLEYRRLFSEVWGTFLLVLVAAGGGVIGATSFGGDLTLPMKALAPGMMVMGIIFFMGTISGAHLNPAVTLAFAVRGNFPWRRVPGYIIAEVVGATLAALFLNAMYGGILNGATEPTPSVTPAVAILTEAVLTLGLVSVILGTASGARNVGINGAIAVGAYIGLVSVWGAPVTGASTEPGSLPRADARRRRPDQLLHLSHRASARGDGRGPVRLRLEGRRTACSRRRSGAGHLDETPTAWRGSSSRTVPTDKKRLAAEARRDHPGIGR